MGRAIRSGCSGWRLRLVIWRRPTDQEQLQLQLLNAGDAETQRAQGVHTATSRIFLGTAARDASNSFPSGRQSKFTRLVASEAVRANRSTSAPPASPALGSSGSETKRRQSLDWRCFLSFPHVPKNDDLSGAFVYDRPQYSETVPEL